MTRSMGDASKRERGQTRMRMKCMPGSSCEESSVEAAAQGKGAQSEQRPSPESEEAQMSRDD